MSMARAEGGGRGCASLRPPLVQVWTSCPRALQEHHIQGFGFSPLVGEPGESWFLAM